MTIEEFQKIDLRIAEIISAEKLEWSDKLIKLTVNLGLEKRQIVAGIAKKYKAEELIGKKIVIVYNIEPRMFRGIESQGMVLAAHEEDGEPVLLVPEKGVPAGVKVT
jgi:methionyl-tRNA synthetase